MQLKLDMSCNLLNVYTKFQIDISKHVDEKSGKRGRTDGRTDRRTDGQTDGRTLPRHNTSRFSNGRIKTIATTKLFYLIYILKMKGTSQQQLPHMYQWWLPLFSALAVLQAFYLNWDFSFLFITVHIHIQLSLFGESSSYITSFTHTIFVKYWTK